MNRKASNEIGWRRLAVLLLIFQVHGIPADPGIRRSGNVKLLQTFSIDLDDLSDDWPFKDIRFGAVSELEFYLGPVQGARMAIFGRSQPSEQACEASRMTGNNIPLSALVPGLHICVKTNEGRFADVRIDAVKPLSPDFVRGDISTLASLSFSFVVWEKRK
jgi:hypothetical protein